MNNILSLKLFKVSCYVKTIIVDNDGNKNNSTKETTQRAALRRCLPSSVITTDYGTLYSSTLCVIFITTFHTHLCIYGLYNSFEIKELNQYASTKLI
jgi:hypothetical protein